MSVTSVEKHAPRVARPARPAQDVPLPARVCGACGEWLPHACAIGVRVPDRMRGAVQAAEWLSRQHRARRAGEAVRGRAVAGRRAAARRKIALLAAARREAGARHDAARPGEPAPQQQPERRRWVLRDDGILDELSVNRAAAGVPVQLTLGERAAAARLIIAAGGGPSKMAVRLHMSGTRARQLYVQITGRAPGPVGTGTRAGVPA